MTKLTVTNAMITAISSMSNHQLLVIAVATRAARRTARKTQSIKQSVFWMTLLTALQLEMRTRRCSVTTKEV